MNALLRLIFIIMWICGIVIAKGFWSTFFSVLIFPYGWYLVIEKIMIFYGVV